MLIQYLVLQVIYVFCGGVEGIVDVLCDSGCQQEIVLVCYGLFSDSELVLIDGIIDIMFNYWLDEFVVVMLCVMVDVVLCFYSEVILFFQFFDIIIKENM